VDTLVRWEARPGNQRAPRVVWGLRVGDYVVVITALLPHPRAAPPDRARLDAQGWSGGMARLARYNAPSAERRRASTVRPSAGYTAIPALQRTG